jgi:hypothetical protein
MRNEYLFIGFAALLIGSVVGGIALSDYYKEVVPHTCEGLLEVASYIWLPESVSDLFMDDEVILHMRMYEGTEVTGHGLVRQGKLTEFGCGRTESYDFEIWMSDVNAMQLATSEKPITTFVTLWRRGEIRVEANGTENEMKLANADMLVAQDDEPVPEAIRDAFSVFLD